MKKILLLPLILITVSCLTVENRSEEKLSQDSEAGIEKKGPKKSLAQLEDLFWEFNHKDVPEKTDLFFSVLDINDYERSGLHAGTIDTYYTLKNDTGNKIDVNSAIESYLENSSESENTPVPFSQIVSDFGNPKEITFRYINPYDLNNYLLEKYEYVISYTIMSYDNISFYCNNDSELVMIKVREPGQLVHFRNEYQTVLSEIRAQASPGELDFYDGFLLTEGIRIGIDDINGQYFNWREEHYEFLELRKENIWTISTKLPADEEYEIREICYFLK